MSKKQRIKNKQAQPVPVKEVKCDWTAFTVVAILAFLLRAVVMSIYPGYSTDIGCFSSWSDVAFNSNLVGFYTSGVFCDYSPGYIYVLYLTGMFKNIFAGLVDIETLVKLSPIICDIVTGYLVYRFSFKKLANTVKGGHLYSLLMSALVLFNPLYVINSAAWGQVDSVFTLVLVLAVYLMIEGKTNWGAFVYGIAFLIKPQAVIVGPAVLAIYLSYKSAKTLFAAVGIGIGTIIGGALPFSFTQLDKPFWLLELYYNTMFNQYKYTSLNAPNLYGALGKQALPLEYDFMGKTFEFWGTIFMVLGIVSVFVWFAVALIKGRNVKEYAYLLSAYAIFIFFMLATKMHERYIFPAMLFLVFDFMQNKKTSSLALSFAIGAVNGWTVLALLIKSYDKVYYYGAQEGIFLAMSYLNIIMVVALGVMLAVRLFKNNEMPEEKVGLI